MHNETEHANPLKDRRVAAGLSQADLARLIKRHPATISCAERSGFVSRDMARRCAEVLGCQPEDLRPAGGRP